MGLTGPLRLAGYTAILRVWAYRVRYATPLVAVLLVSIVAVVAGWTEPRFVVPTAQFCALAGMVLLWAGFFAAVQRQNHPLPARWLPGQLRCLREVTVLGFLAVVLPSAWLLATSPLQVPVPAALILSALACLLLAFIVRWPWLWVAGWVVGSSVAAWLPVGIKAATKTRMLEIYEDQPASMAAFLLAMAGLALWHLFQSGGPGHVRSWKRHAQLRNLLEPRIGSVSQEATKQAWFAGFVDGSSRAFSWLRLLWMNWLIRNARPTVRSVMARAELTASPQTHWAATLGALLLIALGVAIGLTVTSMLRADGMVLGGIVVQSFAFSYLGMLMGPVAGATSSILRRRREQALLLLLPGVPRGQALNRQWAARQMIGHALNWVLALALVLGLQALASHLSGSDTSMSFWSRAAVGFAAMVLPMGILQWRNWSIESEPTPTRTVLLSMMVVGGTAALAALADSRPFLQPAYLLGGSVLITLLLVALRWPSINRYPSFWPVGRDA